MGASEYLDFRLLKYIVAVAEEGTFTAAAARLHLSQSALSTQIRLLEENLGIKIFDRERGTKLTAEGKVLLRYGRDGLKTRDHIVETIQAIHAGRMKPFRLGFTPFVLNPLLKVVTDLYRDLIPDSEIVPESDGTQDVVTWLRDGECDAALVTLPINSEALELTVLERHRLVVCMRADDLLAAEEEVPAAALDGKICIFTYQKHHPLAYELLLHMFSEIGVTARPCKPTMNIDHVQWMVKEGGCYSLIRAGRHLAQGLTTRPIAEANWTIDTAIVCKRDHGNPALSLLIEELRKRYNIQSSADEKKSTASVSVQAVSHSHKDDKSNTQIPLFGAHARS
jgi:DNA-binding transcriptional LysR family regulator